MLESLGAPTVKLIYVLGSSFEKSPEYVMDLYKLSALISENDARRAGSEIVKQESESGQGPLSGLLYPLLQVLDEEHLDVDAQLGGNVSESLSKDLPPDRGCLGVDQRKLFVAAKEWLPKLGYKQV
jgi:tyrosyl-tRNA synthetase